MKRVVEIVCCSPQDCFLAHRAGAGRIELCCAIELGGLTPSVATLRDARDVTELPIMVMLRPRPGDFCYSDAECQTMAGDARAFEQAEGLVFGIVDENACIDVKRCKLISDVASGRELVFHRAFDSVLDPIEGLETLIDLGFKRVLTSGQFPSAAEGVEAIRRLVEKARGRIEVMPCGGIRSNNVAKVLETGCESVHLAPHRDITGPKDWGGYRIVDDVEVKSVVARCNLGTSR